MLMPSFASAGRGRRQAHFLCVQGIRSCQGTCLPSQSPPTPAAIETFILALPPLPAPASPSRNPQVDEAVKKQIQWFYCADGSSAGAKAGGAKAGGAAPVNSAAITDVAFFGFGDNARDELLHMYTSSAPCPTLRSLTPLA